MTRYSSIAGDRAILELGDHLLKQMDRLELASLDDLRLDPFGLLTRRGLDRIPRRPFQEAVVFGRQAVCQVLEGVVGLIAEDEADVPRIIPAVEMLGLREVGIAPQGILRKPAPRQRSTLVQEDVGLLLRGAVAAAIDQVERLGGIGQRDQEGW